MVSFARRLASICTVLVAGLTVTANNESAVYVGPGVPYGVAPTGNYSGQWRPQVHFSPPYGFMNDPNGLFRSANGTWHLYYQINPTGLVSDFQHWGHATSDDLYHWINQPIALFPTDNETYVWTGAAVVDTNNTSGFFPNQTDGVIAMYSLWNSTLEVQGISYSSDGGYTFTPYHGNPVIQRPVSFGDIGLGWYEDHWYMVTTFDDFKIGIFTSPNMIDWTPTSNVSYIGLIGSNYQCPNLKQVPVKNSTESIWVLWMSISPGGPNGGAVQQFVPGDFNGTHFTPLDGVARLTDFAEDFYAAQFWSNLPVEDTYSIGWASNWEYTQQVPTASEGWRSAMSLPRRNRLNEVKPHQWQLVSAPADLTPVMGDNLWSGSLMNQSNEVDFSSVSSGAVVLQFNITTPNELDIAGLKPWLNFSFCSSDSDESLIGGYDWSLSTISVDRSKTYGFDYPYYVDKWSIGIFETLYQVQVVFDRSMIEVFLNEGDISGTMVAYPNSPLNKVQIGSSDVPDGLIIEASVTALNSIWE